MTGAVQLSLSLSHLREWLWQAFQGKLEVTELTAAGVGGSEPVLQTATVHHGQRAGALTRRQQLLHAATLMADATEWLIPTQTGARRTRTTHPYPHTHTHTFHISVSPSLVIYDRPSMICFYT